MTALNLKTFLPFAKGAKPAKPYFEKHLGVLSKLSKLSIFKTTLTHHHTPCKITTHCKSSVGFSKPRNKGDNTPIIKSVFLCLPFLDMQKFLHINSIMTALFVLPLWQVVPLYDIANSNNAVTRFLAKSSDGFTPLNKGITA